MADVTAELVKELREKSGARMLDCKKALEETKADSADKGAWLSAAETWLRKKSLAAGGAIQERAASEGLLGYKVSPDGKLMVVVEMSANTDFVAKNAEFIKLLNDLVELVLQKPVGSAEELSALSLNGTPVSETVRALAGKIGENISIKRVVRIEGEFGYYIHHDNKQGAIVELSGLSGAAAQALGKDLSMHVVFAKPNYLKREEVPAEMVKKETEIAAERLKSDPKMANKPADILNKIASGQLQKFYAQVVLPDQDYYKDNSKSVTQVLKDNGSAAIKSFVRFEVGKI